MSNERAGPLIIGGATWTYAAQAADHGCSLYTSNKNTPPGLLECGEGIFCWESSRLWVQFGSRGGLGFPSWSRLSSILHIISILLCAMWRGG